jgi:hypothetical protein
MLGKYWLHAGLTSMTQFSQRFRTYSLGSLLLAAACTGGGGGGGSAALSALPLSPPAGAFTASHSGLTALAAGDTEIRMDWDLPEGPYEAALYQSTDPATLLSGTPAQSPLSGTNAIVTGLVNGTEYFFTLAIRPIGGTDWTPSGVVLSAVPNAPICVDAAAAANGDGTPALPYQNLGAALQAAATRQHANIWVRTGTYANADHTIRAGTEVFGGFDATAAAFDLASRNPASHGTIFTGSLRKNAFTLAGAGAKVVLDGLDLDGLAQGSNGILQQTARFDLRSVAVRNFTDSGLRLNHHASSLAAILVVACNVRDNSGHGLAAEGALALQIDGSAFDSNRRGGVVCDDLTAPSGQTTVLSVRNSRFYGNAADGLEIKLEQEEEHEDNGHGTPSTGRFAIDIRGSRFESNGGDGIEFEQEYEEESGWGAHVTVRDSIASANGGSGIRIETEASSECLIHNVRANANRNDGITIGEEDSAGHVVVSSSELRGNQRSGINADECHRVVLASHCVFAGNLRSGIEANSSRSTATNCIAQLQPNAFDGVRTFGCVTTNDATFVNAPRAYAKVITNNSGTLGLDRDFAVQPGDTVELADNDSAETVSTFAGRALVLLQAPTNLRLPASISAFASTSVTEDIHLAVGAAAIGQGLAEAGMPAVNPGPYGSPLDGTPGVANPQDVRLLVLEQANPPLSSRTGLTQALALQFSQSLAMASVTTSNVRVLDGQGTVVAAGTSILGNVLTLNPPAGGWPRTTLRVELYASITNTDGTPIAAPMVIQFEAH